MRILRRCGITLMISAMLSSLSEAQAETCTLQWVRQFGTTDFDRAYGVAVDSGGNVYVCGTTFGTFPGQVSAGGDDAFLRKYDSSGTMVWTRQFGSPLDDWAFAVAVDSSGYVYVVGPVNGALPGQTSNGGQDAFIRKYDSSGSEIWTHQFGTTDNEFAQGVSLDGAGNVYVSGQIGYFAALPGQSTSGGSDAFVRKYDSAGIEVWTRQFGSSDNEASTGAAADAAGDVALCGVTQGTLPGQTALGGLDAFIKHYDPGGNEIFTRQFGTALYDRSEGVGRDGLGNIYVGGLVEGTLSGQVSAGGEDAYVRKYDTAGTEIWTRQFGSPSSDTGEDLYVDGNSLVYVVGQTSGAFPGQTLSGFTDAWVRKYDAAGTEIGTLEFGSPGQDIGLGVAADGLGRPYVVGDTDGTFPGQTSVGGQDAFLARLECLPSVSQGGPGYCIAGVSTGTNYSWFIDLDGDGFMDASEPGENSVVNSVPVGQNGPSLAAAFVTSINANSNSQSTSTSAMVSTPTNCFTISRPHHCSAAVTTVCVVDADCPAGGVCVAAIPPELYVGPVNNPTNCHVTASGCTYNPTITRVPSIPPSNVPALNDWGFPILILGLLTGGMYLIRRRQIPKASS